jgi:hypothetical protein
MDNAQNAGPTAEKIAYIAACLLGLFSLLLLATDIYMAIGSRNLHEQINRNQSNLTAGQTFSQVNQNLVQALAEASVKNNDTQMKQLLASQGITVNANPSADAAKTPTTPRK